MENYERLNDDGPLVKQISLILHSKIMAIQGKNDQLGSTQNVNQGQLVTVPRPSWKANLTYYKCGKRDI